jgi:hypothetical protein
MPPLEPIRERVKAAMAAHLAAIVAGDQYFYTPTLVTRQTFAQAEYSSFADELKTGPVYGVVRSVGSVAERTRGEDYDHRILVDVVTYVKGVSRGVSGEIADTKAERAWADELRCLRRSINLGGIVINLDPLTDPQGYETDRGAWEPHAYIRQTWVALATGQ